MIWYFLTFYISLAKTYAHKKCCQEENIDYIEKANLEDIKNRKFVVSDPNM
jgi:hypothetical protein